MTERAESGVTDPVKILAVDDVADNLLALEAVLAGPGVHLLLATSGEQALEILLENEVAVALLDVRMPGMDGFELAEVMRASPRTRTIPIIFLTATSPDRSRAFRGYEAGAVDFLHKPLEPHVLRGKVEVFVELHRQRVRLAEQVELLRETVRLNETFAAVLGHDLRGPLSAIHSGALVLERNPESERVARIAAVVHRSATRMARMIDQLLDFANLRHGGTELAPVPADLRAMLEQILLEHGEDGATPIGITAEGDPTGSWDPDRLLRVLGNLIGNARRHGDGATPITIHIDGRAPARVAIEITNGGAIDAAILPRIFEPFRSGDTAGRRAGGGLGLGLYIVKETVEAHGGTVTVRSDPANGTCVRIELPREARGRRDDPRI